MGINRRIASAGGGQAVDLLLANARIVNVFSGEVVSNHIAVDDGLIVGFGDYAAKAVVDLGRRFVAPGFIDAHVHIESAMVSVPEFCRAVLPLGTTTVVADPHEIANVLGLTGIEYMIASGKAQPMNFYFMLPSCVPATSMETSGAVLNADAICPLLKNSRVLGLAEMMNFPGVVHRDPDVLRKIENTLAASKPVDGHAPGLTGKPLYAYVAAGISSDHECVLAEEAMEKLRCGMHIMIREGSGAKNLDALLSIISPKTAHQLMWCTDDRHPHDILAEGHIDFIVRKAISGGVDPATAIRIGTLNPARYFGLRHVGAVAPGRRADLVVFSDLSAPKTDQVYAAGVLAAEGGRMLSGIDLQGPAACPSAMRVDPAALDFSIPAKGREARVIELVSDQIVTKSTVMEAVVDDRQQATADVSRDMLKIAVVERHTGSGKTGKGFVRGFGLKKGAIVSSVAHDSHNLIVVGTTDADMKAAVRGVVETGGGLAVAWDGRVQARLALPLAGLMSKEPLDQVRSLMDGLLAAVREMGATPSDPFTTLSFLALPVIPEIRITDKGVFDVAKFSHVGLFL